MKTLGSSSEARASRQRWKLGPPGISSSQQVRGQGSGVFGISIDAFRIIGGLIVLLIALEMLGFFGNGESSLGTSGHDPVVTGVFPMAVPLFAGPGAITAVMIYAHADDKHPLHDLHIATVVLAVSALIVLGLQGASPVSRFITSTMQNVLNRLLGMIVGALDVEFILEGLAGFFLVDSVVG